MKQITMKWNERNILRFKKWLKLTFCLKGFFARDGLLLGYKTGYYDLENETNNTITFNFFDQPKAI